MSFEKPLIILAVPRGGSSLTARIFNEHGFWVGRWQTKASYPTFENHEIKRFLETQYWSRMDHGEGLGRVVPMHVYMEANLREYCRAVVPHNREHWLFKGGAMYASAWCHYFPDAYFLCLKRDFDQVVASHVKIRGEGERARAIQNVSGLYETMEMVRAQFPEQSGLIRTDDLFDGDYSAIEETCKQFGIEFDAAAVERCIDPKQWHFRGESR